MTALRHAEAYFAAWNAHDTDAILATFAPGGSYADPNVPDGVSGPHLAGYAGAIFAAFSDLEFEIVKQFEGGEGVIIAEWLMTGTHDGELRGLPPSGRKIAVPGIDVIEAGADGIHAVRGYFSNGTMMEQLDCQVIVQPKRIGPVSFGNSTYTSTGNTAKPGVLGITQIQVNDPEKREKLRDLTRATIQEIVTMPGFISTCTTMSADGHGTTLTAWEDMDSAKAAVTGKAHSAAMKAFFAPDGIGDSGWTSFWTEGRMNARLMRCAECGVMAMLSAEDQTCACGAALPEPAPYL
jgi:steroid delta-isomerase-like uncharacterized protein